MRNILFSIVLILCFSVKHAGTEKQAGQFKIAFYNTENCFDTIDDRIKTMRTFYPIQKSPDK